MNKKADIRVKEYDLSFSGSDCFKNGAIVFHGDIIDDRGDFILSANKENGVKAIFSEYDSDRMALSFSGKIVGIDDLDSLMPSIVGDCDNVILEATTLGFAELFVIFKSLLSLKLKKITVVYAEPIQYSQDKDKKNEDIYELTDSIAGFKPIPGALVDLTSNEVTSGVFFLGYESKRLELALEEYQMIIGKEISVIFGVPAFETGWEMNSIRPHLPILSERRFGIDYCSASDPRASYVYLEEIRKGLDLTEKMFVAPLGPKPFGIASAIFAAVYSKSVGLLYDHPKRKKERTSGIRKWHKYTVFIQYEE